LFAGAGVAQAVNGLPDKKWPKPGNGIKIRLGLGGKAAEKALMQASVFSLAAWLALGLVLDDIVLAALAGLLLLFPAFALLLWLPTLEKRRHAGLVEASLPFCLMGIAIELGLGVPFLKALEHASQGEGECAAEFGVVCREIVGQGASVQQALRHFSERTGRRMVKRAVMQLSAAFEQGSSEGSEPVRRIASEILARQRVEGKLFSGKLVVLSLLFIAVSAIIPALFQSFSIVGSMVLHMDFTAMQLFLIIVVLFPAIDLAVLFYIRGKTPVFLRG